jgi:phage terminase large subunit-like protein
MTTAGVVHAETKKAEGKYCTALASLKGDLQKLDALNEQSKVSELKPIMDRLDKDTQQIEKEGSKISTPAGKQFMASAERLKVEGRAVSNDTTIDQVKSRIRDDASNLQQSAQQLANEASCTEATPPTSEQPHT